MSLLLIPDCMKEQITLLFEYKTEDKFAGGGAFFCLRCQASSGERIQAYCVVHYFDEVDIEVPIKIRCHVCGTTWRMKYLGDETPEILH